MNAFKLELRKTNIKPYCLSAAAIFICLLGLMFIFAWVPHLDSGDKNAAIMFSSYDGIFSISGAVALMAFSALYSAMGYRLVIKEYSGANAILLFCYPINRKTVLFTKIKVLLVFASITLSIALVGGFSLFYVLSSIFSLVDSSVYFIDFVNMLRNCLILIMLANGIMLWSVRIGFVRKSNSITVISAIFGSMLFANGVAQINNNCAIVLGLSSLIFLTGITATYNLAKKIEKMET